MSMGVLSVCHQVFFFVKFFPTVPADIFIRVEGNVIVIAIFTIITLIREVSAWFERGMIRFHVCCKDTFRLKDFFTCIA